jgi:AraC-like DNA-binding protein
VSVVFRADDAPPASRLDYWNGVVGDAVGPHEVRAPEGIDAGDRLVLGEVGPVLVGELSAARPAWVRRSRQGIRGTDSDAELCKVHVLVEGHGVVRQDGREACLRPGDFTLIDLLRPASWAMAPMRCVAVGFPRALLPLPPDAVARLTAVRVPGDRGVGRLVSSLARDLPHHLDDATPAGGVRLGAAVLDLLAVALAERLGDRGRVPADTEQRALLVRIHAFIEQHLGDPGLSPAAIAAANGVSVRYLYKLFEAEGTTVAGWVRRRRLERCRRDLLDPALRRVAVSAIAARWGLVNPAHFSRVFRAAYGAPPAEYRVQGDRAGIVKDRAGEGETRPRGPVTLR